MTITMAAKKMFFDRLAVLRAAGRARVRALTKSGAFVRRRARSSIRPRRAVSEPGRPPSSHTGLLRDKIWFAYDQTQGSVVVGPLVFRPRENIPRVLEHGGRSTRTRFDGRRLVREPVLVRPRPYMRPSLVAEIAAGSIPKVWADSVRA